MLEVHVLNCCSVLWATAALLQEEMNPNSKDSVQTLFISNQDSLWTFWINIHSGFNLWRQKSLREIISSENIQKQEKYTKAGLGDHPWCAVGTCQCPFVLSQHLRTAEKIVGHRRKTSQMVSNSDLHRASVAGSAWKYRSIFTYKVEAFSLCL